VIFLATSAAFLFHLRGPQKYLAPSEPTSTSPTARKATVDSSGKPFTNTGANRNVQGCNGRESSSQMFLRLNSLDLKTGIVDVNGVDYRRPETTPFTWNWGDGSITQGWFPQSHVYPTIRQDYLLQVTSHEDDGSSECAQINIPRH
jgi:hypothetical protein